MRNKDNEKNVNRNVGMGREETRRPGSEGVGSSSGRSSESLDNEKSNISRDDRSPGRTGNTGSSEGRH
ncbi:MAG: hypothetical protein ACXW5U_23340 [Thermoanaerobaculia bacterium]